jgi:hypothetical protein
MSFVNPSKDQMLNKHLYISHIHVFYFFVIVTCKPLFVDSAKVISAANNKAFFHRKINGKFEPLDRLYKLYKNKLFRATKIHKNLEGEHNNSTPYFFRLLSTSLLLCYSCQ